VQTTDAGVYDVIVANSAGSDTSAGATVTVLTPPAITAQPQSVSVPGGQPAQFTVTASGSGPLAYQWQKNGTNLAGATMPALAIGNAQPGDAGEYRVAVTNAAGSVSSATATLTVTVDSPPPPPAPAARLINLSSLGLSGAGNQTLIAGFVIRGSGTKDVLVRAVGPGLTDFGVGGVLPDPQLGLYRDSTRLAENDNWESGNLASQVMAVSQSVGAFALETGSTDAVIIAQLPAGSYSAQVAGAAGHGMALVELYDAGPAGADSARLINIATRGDVAPDHFLVAGFVVKGDKPRKLLLRGVGPSLAAFGVGNLLLAPRLRLFKDQTLIQENENWNRAADPAAIAAAAAGAGAFPLPAGSNDASLLVELERGLYSAQVSGVGDTSGVALVEVYEIGN
jgi:hypothetical protein